MISEKSMPIYKVKYEYDYEDEMGIEANSEQEALDHIRQVFLYPSKLKIISVNKIDED